MVVVDIQEVDSFEICVHFAYPRLWSSVMTETESNRALGSSFSTASPPQRSSVGFLIATPFTALQGPDTSPISINVFVSSTDMTFNQYSDMNGINT
jgi:hypothetical protein